MSFNVCKEIANLYKECSRYNLYPPSNQKGALDLQEYFTYKYKKHSITIELGEYAGETNVCLDNFPDIWERNKNPGFFLAEHVLFLTNE